MGTRGQPVPIWNFFNFVIIYSGCLNYSSLTHTIVFTEFMPCVQHYSKLLGTLAECICQKWPPQYPHSTGPYRVTKSTTSTSEMTLLTLDHQHVTHFSTVLLKLAPGLQLPCCEEVPRSQTVTMWRGYMWVFWPEAQQRSQLIARINYEICE